MVVVYGNIIEIECKNRRIWNDGYGVSQTFGVPLDGFIIQLRKIRPLDGVRPRVMCDGAEAILIGKRGRRWVYVMPVGEGNLIEVDPNDGSAFEENRDGFISFLKHTKMYGTVVEGDPVFIGAGESGAEVFVVHGLSVYRNRLEWDEFSEKNFRRGAEKIMRLPKVLKEAVRITPYKKCVEVRINRRDYRIYYDGRVGFADDFVGEVDEFEEIMKASYTTLELRDYPVIWSRDGELLTPSGAIRAEKIDENVERIIDWSYRILSKFMFWMDCTEKCHGEVICDFFVNPIRIGSRLYYFDQRYRAWRSEGNIFVKQWKSIEYDGRHIYIGQETLIPGWLRKRLENGEDASISEIIPGFPETGKIEPVSGKMFAMTGKKAIEFEIGKVLKRVEVIVPYVEGLYRVWSSRDDPVDVWSPLSVREIPEEHVVEPVLPIGGFEGVTYMQYEQSWREKMHTVTYFFGEERRIIINERSARITDGKRTINLEAEAMNVISRLRNFDEIFAAASVF